jgi:hypothetical protein
MFVRAWAGYMVVNMVGRLYGMIPYKDLPTHPVGGGGGGARVHPLPLPLCGSKGLACNKSHLPTLSSGKICPVRCCIGQAKSCKAVENFSHTRGVTKRCRLSLLTNSALVLRGQRGGLRGLSQ